MKRSAFTLIELLISLVLFGLIAVLLFGTIDNMRSEFNFFLSKEKVISDKNKIISLMRNDFSRPQTLTLLGDGKDYTIASVIGSEHSLYGINRPYVIWLVLKNNDTLIRLESASAITLPLSTDALYLAHSDIIGEHCEFFRVYTSGGHRLIYVKFENQAPLVVETAQ